MISKDDLYRAYGTITGYIDWTFGGLSRQTRTIADYVGSLMGGTQKYIAAEFRKNSYLWSYRLYNLGMAAAIYLSSALSDDTEQFVMGTDIAAFLISAVLPENWYELDFAAHGFALGTAMMTLQGTYKKELSLQEMALSAASIALHGYKGSSADNNAGAVASFSQARIASHLLPLFARTVEIHLIKGHEEEEDSLVDKAMILLKSKN